MDILSFIKEKNLKFPVYCFKGAEYPILFFSSYFIINLKNILSIKYINFEEDINEILSKLSTAFLGQKSFYFLGNINNLENNKKKLLLKFLQDYTGPNTILFFVSEIEENNNFKIIKIDQKYLMENYVKTVYDGDPAKLNKLLVFAKQVSKKYPVLTLDQNYLLLEYASLMGARLEHFINNWVDRIILAEKSLFSLSSYFFSKDILSFLKLWEKIKEDFNEPFWISFWSEQIFRAYYFLDLKNKNDIVAAKKIAFRLPFTFIQKDYKNITVLELSKAHNFLYSIDYNFKNGSSGSALDFFYTNFLLNKFRL